ncbi:protein of unknown function [Limnospira indica PCC 8005]|uniref:Uncharacterized protein n=1 Tax=Limnospira indica PCC 8005 TaxID=376219 RepID=A0A9P1KJK3_9CYAN|nr:protein of unknown function [Limnospira indica PCC 8005]
MKEGPKRWLDIDDTIQLLCIKYFRHLIISGCLNMTMWLIMMIATRDSRGCIT